MTGFSRWLPAIKQTFLTRKGALGIAGLALVGGGLAAPAIASEPAAAPAMTPVADVVQQKAPAAMEVEGYEYEQQPNFYFCGPASARIALTADGHELSQNELAKKLGTTTNGTDSAEDITRVLNNVSGGEDYQTTEIPGQSADEKQTEQMRADLVEAIRDGDPVVANIIGTATDTDGNQHSLPGGHYLTVVGYKDDGRIVKIADPFETRGDGTYWMSIDNLADWTASRGYSA